MQLISRGAIAAALLFTSLGSAFADPTPAQVDLAKKILISVGLKASMDQIVPAMLSQLQGQLLQMHPEMGKSLHETLVALQPEFNQGEEAVFNDTSRVLATRLNEAVTVRLELDGRQRPTETPVLSEHVAPETVTR